MHSSIDPSRRIHCSRGDSSFQPSPFFQAARFSRAVSSPYLTQTTELMTIKTLFYAYLLGGVTFIPLVILGAVFFTIYSSVPVGDADSTKRSREKVEADGTVGEKAPSETEASHHPPVATNDVPRTRKGWLTMRRTLEETYDGSYVTMVRSFLDARSKDPKRSRPKDMWYVVLKGKILYLYEDEEMTECEAAIELGGHDVTIYPDGLVDGELFSKRNAICLKPKVMEPDKDLPSVTKEMIMENEDNPKVEQAGGSQKKREQEQEKLDAKEAAREEAFNPSTPWFIFVRSIIEMEDWYLALLHASDHPAKTPTLAPLQAIFQASDMNHLVTTLDEQPDVIPMRWLNALLGRVFFSYYRTHKLEDYIISRLMKKLSKVKRPTFLSDIVVTEVSVGNTAPTFSKPMLKELTKEGDASLEVHLHYKGEFRMTIEATALISIGTFKSYTVKLVLAAVLKEIEGNLLIKVKRPPTNRIWYGFTQTPRMVLAVEPIVSDRQITWSMILGTIESRVKEIIQESVVMPNMDDIAFFDSQPYQHRGGIWQDAARREKHPSLVPEQTTDDSQSTVPVLAPEASSVPPLSQESSSQPRSQSDEGLSIDLLSSSSVSANGMVTEVTGPELSVPPRGNNRRRSWFSSVRSDTQGSHSRRNSDAEAIPDWDEQRGRAPESDKTAASALRSRSTPTVDNLHPVTPTQERDDPYLDMHISPQSSQRSSSIRSTREHSESISIDSSAGSPDSISIPGKNSSHNSTTSSPNSFLSTLKSRAGDKQALSNTAKEAMRKWGVNWANLRKDSSSKSTVSDDAFSDHGSIGSLIGSRLQPDSHSGVASKGRTSYAEVRAAVEERKGKDRNAHSRSPSPIPMPRAPTDNAVESSSLAATSQGFNPSLFSDSVARSYSSSSSGRLSVGEKSNSSRKSSPDLDVQDRPELVQPPIHVVQPQAKTMTIPGIHASHRGEVMSMGYVAPQPQQEGKPSIQSVYRLWKSPPLSGQDQRALPQTHQSQDPFQITEGDSGERNRDVTVLVSSPSAHVSPHIPLRPVPPPLPPRSVPVAISRAPFEVSSSSPSESSVSASQTLKSIANQDERKRASLENEIQIVSPAVSTDTDTLVTDSDHSPTKTPITKSISISNPGPPLPPRRIPA